MSSNQNIFTLIRERFHPLTRFCGPLHGGTLFAGEVSDTLYLDMISRWLWNGESLSDEQLSEHVAPELVVRALLASVSCSMTSLMNHVDNIVEAEGDTVSLLRYYLEDSGATVVDGMALGKVLSSRIGERKH